MLIQHPTLSKYNVQTFFSYSAGLCLFYSVFYYTHGVKQRHRKAFFTRDESLYDPQKDIKTAIVCFNDNCHHFSCGTG